MLSNTQIILNRLTYIHNENVVFQDLILTFGNEKYGIVGRNGIGKSTLIKLIIGELIPSSGNVQRIGQLTYCPQEINSIASGTVSQILEADIKLDALKRVALGSFDITDYEIIGDDWEFEQHLSLQLAKFELDHISLNREFSTLSGGEKNRLLLAKSFSSNSNFILLDEPTNNLDINSRKALYTTIRNWKQGLLVVSHDRTLLNLMDKIIEISTLGVQVYGGNYDNYVQQKNIEQQAAQQALDTSNQILKQAEQTIQERKERHTRAQAKGKKDKNRQILAKGRNSDFSSSDSKERSERTQRRINLQANRKLENITNNIDTLRKKVAIEEKLCLKLPKTSIPKDKKVLTINQLTFHYPSHSTPLINHFCCEIQGPQRIALWGNNGSGKTTLLKLIIGELKPDQGSIFWGIDKNCYLDQHVNILMPELSIIENFSQINPDIANVDARFSLAHFLFRNRAALKKVKDLSSGEKLRAALACILMSNKPPQFLILDEPTNHLDLDSIRSIEAALRSYEGAILIVSHDKVFLQNINVDRIICAPFKNPLSEKVLANLQ